MRTTIVIVSVVADEINCKLRVKLPLPRKNVLTISELDTVSISINSCNTFNIEKKILLLSAHAN